jgi:hypothetical protein
MKISNNGFKSVSELEAQGLTEQQAREQMLALDKVYDAVNELLLSEILGAIIPAKASITDLIDTDAIALNESDRTIIEVKGDDGNATLASLPFGNTDTPSEFGEVTLIGLSDTDTVTITHNDANYGCLLNGNAVLQKGYCLTLIWNLTLLRYIEKSRNF